MNINKYGLSFVIFGFVCLITAWVLSFHTGDTIKKSFPAAGGKFGPIKILEKNEVVNIKVSQDIASNHWSAIEAEVVDEKDNYLFAFSEELWFETGYDSEGRWAEGKRDYDISVTFPLPGTFFINFNSEKSYGANVGNIRVEANKKLGSSIAHIWLGIISLLIGIGMLIYSGNLNGLIEWLED